jgi:ankyrin repeat protein
MRLEVDAKLKNVTTYMLAAKANKIKLLNDISVKGVDVNEKSKTGMTALLFAAMSGNLEVIDYLIMKGADLNAKTNEGETVLGYAVLSKKPAAVKILLDAKADVNAKCIKNYTPLMYAIRNNDNTSLRSVLDKNSGTLINAVESNENEMVKLLLSYNADVNLYGTDLASPMSIAVSLKNLDVAKLIKSYGCRLSLFTEVGFYPVKLGTDRRCDDKIMNVVFDCETNYAASLNLVNKLSSNNSDTVKSTENEIKVLMKRSFEEIDNRRSEYAKKVAAKAAKNIGLALLTAAANTASYAAAAPGSMYWVNNYNWDSNEFNRAIINNLKIRKDYIEKKILEFQSGNPQKMDN